MQSSPWRDTSRDIRELLEARASSGRAWDNMRLGMGMRLTGVASEVAADEVAPKLVRRVHDDEGAGCRIDDEIAGLGDGGDEALC
jgi:hypothetical protein